MLTYAIKPDGNCLFRAVAQGHALTHDTFLTDAEETSRAAYFRRAAVEYNCRSQDMAPFINDLETTCRQMKLDGIYGGELEIAAMSRGLNNVHIVVYETRGTRRLLSRTSEYGPKNRRPINLLYLRSQQHYNLLIDAAALSRMPSSARRAMQRGDVQSARVLTWMARAGIDYADLTPRVGSRVVAALKRGNVDLALGLAASVRIVSVRGSSLATKHAVNALLNAGRLGNAEKIAGRKKRVRFSPVTIANDGTRRRLR